MEKKEIEAKIEELEKWKFDIQMADYLTEEDKDTIREINKKIYDLKDKLKGVKE